MNTHSTTRLKADYSGAFNILLLLGFVFQVEPLMIFLLMTFTLIIIIIARIRIRQAPEYIEGGSIVGFLIVWTLGKVFYNQIGSMFTITSNVTTNLNTTFTLSLILIMLSWFLIQRQKQETLILFNLPPIISDLVLSFWKLVIVIVLVTVFLNITSSLMTINEALLSLSAIIDYVLGIQVQQKNKNNYFFLNSPSAIMNVLILPIKTIKWTLFLALFIFLNVIVFTWYSALAVSVGIVLSIIMVSIGMYNIGRISGLFEKKYNLNNESFSSTITKIKNISVEDVHFFRLKDKISIRQENRTLILSSGMILANIPIDTINSNTTQKYYFKFIPKETKKTFSISEPEKVSSETKKPNTLHFELKGRPGILVLSLDNWHKVERLLVPLNKSEAVELLNLKDQTELDHLLTTLKTSPAKIQQELRARFRGLPSIKITNNTIKIIIKDNSIMFSPEQLAELNLENNMKITIIKGKDEYLFYALKDFK